MFMSKHPDCFTSKDKLVFENSVDPKINNILYNRIFPVNLF